MNISSGRRRLTSIVLWLPVGAIAAALFLVPSGTDAAAPDRRAGTLNITPKTVYSPGHTTGGQLLTWSGDVGNGSHKLFMERRGNNNPGTKWTRVQDPATGQDFSITTNANGEFDFDFPAPAMDKCWFRLVGKDAGTDDHQFHSVFQDVEVGLATPAIVGSPFTLTGDTALRAKDNRPIFPGRAAVLQERNDAGGWTNVANGSVGGDGKITNFAPITVFDPGTRVYRIRLADWVPNGDFVGWYPSHPFSVNVVQQ